MFQKLEIANGLSFFVCFRTRCVRKVNIIIIKSLSIYSLSIYFEFPKTSFEIFYSDYLNHYYPLILILVNKIKAHEVLLF